ncbi:MAG: hypothetical protein O2968_15805 [Acidobacteria bacterium]|nr:hypothetical protein [Acidobacteriota bacterium]
MHGERLIRALLFTAVLLAAQSSLSYQQLHQMLRSSIEQNLRDKEIASYLKKQQLGFELTDAQIEEFQGWGLGSRSLKALRELQPQTLGLSAAIEPEAAKVEEPEQPPPPSLEEQQRIIAEARSKALSYTSRLPDFICLQVTRRFVDPSGLEMDWIKQDEIKTRVSYFDKHENYDVVSVNNKVTDAAMHDLGGATSSGEFGSMLAELFDPLTAANFTWARHSQLRDRGVYVFEFVVPKHRSRWSLNYMKTDTIVVGYRGLVYIDKEREEVLRIYMQAEGVPTDFPIQIAQSRLDYEFTEISGQEFLLPLKARVRMRQGRYLSRNDVEFRLYRKFATDASISFDESENLEPLPEEPVGNP